MEEGYEGIERAELVVMNVRSDAERDAAQVLVEEVRRLRKDQAVFDDVIGPHGNRVPVTAVVANVSNPRDRGLKKAVARVRRALPERVR